MRKNLTVFLVLCAALLHAQTPDKMSYQAVVRNGAGELVKNTQIGMRISILKGSATGTVVYTETLLPNPTTNANGLVSIQFGGGAGFNAIDWSNGVYFLKTETDISGGANYTIVGTSQLLSVPYSIHSKTAETMTGTLPYSQITGAPTPFSGNYNDLTNKPTLATVATSGNYSDLTNKPTIPAVNQPPMCSITVPANNATVYYGDNIQVTVAASDADGSIAEVQLYIDGFSYGSKITSPYTFTVNAMNLTPGTYVLTALARDDKGGTATNSVTLNITAASTPQNNTCSGAIALVLDVPVYGNTTAATAIYGSAFSSTCLAATHNFNGNGREVVYSYTSTSSGPFTVKVTPSASFDAMLWMTSGTCGGTGSTCIGAADNGGAGTPEQITYNGVAGTTYYIYVDSYDNKFYGAFTILVSNPVPNIDWCNVQYPTALVASPGASSGNIYGQIYCAGFTTQPSQISSIEAQLGIGIGNPLTNPGTWTWVAASFNVQTGNNHEYKAIFTAPLAAGTYRYVYRFRVNAGAWVYGGVNGIITDFDNSSNYGILQVQ